MKQPLLAKIAAAAEVSSPTVFNYFGLKDELFIHMVLDDHEFGRETIANWHSSTISVLVNFL